MIPSPTTPILSLLRERTADQHSALDASLQLESSLVLQRYDAFLAASLSVTEAFEPAIAGWLGPFEGPTRAACLRADRTIVAGHLGQPDAPIGPASARLPGSIAEAFGCAYVLEGSTLGGMALARGVEAALDLETGVGTSYLRLRGAGTAPQWKRFLERLDAFGAGASASEREAAARMATDTFDAYARAFSTFRSSRP